MGVKFAKAMGAHVVVITTSASKVEDAKRLGADKIILSTDEEQMKNNTSTLHFILDCVSAQHDINAYLSLLKRDGSLWPSLAHPSIPYLWPHLVNYRVFGA